MVVWREAALGVTAIWAAMNFISATIATLSLDVYARDGHVRKLSGGAPLHAILIGDIKVSPTYT